MKERNARDRYREEADRRLLAGIVEHYAPPELTEAERRAFDARLRARLEGSRAPRAWFPALGAAAVTAGVAVWLVLAGASGPLPSEPAPRGAAVEGDEALAAWEREVFYAGTLAADDDEEEEVAAEAAELPEPYVSIASLLLD